MLFANIKKKYEEQKLSKQIYQEEYNKNRKVELVKQAQARAKADARKPVKTFSDTLNVVVGTMKKNVKKKSKNNPFNQNTRNPFYD